MKLVVTVDTEADNQWQHRPEISLKNIVFLERFQKVCEQYGFPPTYLITYEVATDEKAVSLLSSWQKRGVAEIGAHLHPWTTPPENGVAGPDGKIEHPFPSELPYDLLENKLKSLSRAIHESFGIKPVSYRAGRWGMDERQLKILKDLGFKADCSLTPKVDWRRNIGAKGGRGGKDWRSASVYPYYPSECNIFLAENDKRLLEVPMTVLYTGVCCREKSALCRIMSRLPESFPKKVLNRLFFKRKWLRVFPKSEIGHWRGIYDSAKLNNLPVMEFMIHSSELMPGGSPSSKTESDVDAVYKNLEAMFTLFRDRGVQGVTLGQFADWFNSN
ncbi:MAG: hypothetical protein HYV68_03070 [Candidatus Taylorbacteria bacterium]|nr:hypothetical protein [Candidatus Taylorbacteria bacterium]